MIWAIPKAKLEKVIEASVVIVRTLMLKVKELEDFSLNIYNYGRVYIPYNHDLFLDLCWRSQYFLHICL
jgi:hypothetical protein